MKNILLILISCFIFSCSQQTDNKPVCCDSTKAGILDKPIIDLSNLKFEVVNFDMPNEIKENYQHIICNIEIDSKNHDTIITQLNSSNLVKVYIDSLQKQITELPISETEKNKYYITHYDHIVECKLHNNKTCISREYSFAKSNQSSNISEDDFDIKKLKINNLGLSTLKLDTLIKYFGEPDSNYTGIEEMNDFGKYIIYYYGKSTFISTENEDFSIQEIDLLDNRFKCSIDGIQLNKTIKINEIKKRWPLSFLNKTDLIYNKGKLEFTKKGFYFISLSELNKPWAELHLRFENNTLISIEYFIDNS